MVTLDAGVASQVVPVTPIDDPAVESNENVIVAVIPDPNYVLGSGGAAVTIVSNDQPSDLLVTALTGPTTAGAGAQITVNDTTKNQGQGPSAPSSTGFYLSTNTAIDVADFNLGTRDVPTLAVGTTNPAATVFTVPSNIGVGNYYLLAKADVAGAVTESNESNNVKIGSIMAIGPDLVMSALTTPSSAAPGATISISDATKNQGAGSASTSTTVFYLSSNVLLDDTDTQVGSRSIGSLGPNTTDTATTLLTIPASTTPGTYYIIAKADGASAVQETQELNNVKFSTAIKIGPDLIESSTVVPTAAGAGFPLTIADTVKNQGSSPAGPSTTSFYLSTNSSLDSTDTFLGSRSVAALNAGTTNSGSTTVTIPAGTELGSYFILVSADDTNAVLESAETNNVSYGTTKVGPDLTVFTLTAPPTAVAGATISVTDTTKNAGGGSSGASTTRLYLSSNFTFDAGDQPIGERTVPALGPNGTSAVQTQVTIPAGTAPGLYYIIAVSDADGAVTETTETNNTKALTIRIN